MIFAADFETPEGTFRAVWAGGALIEIYQGADDVRVDQIDVFDFSIDGARVPKTAEEMARRVMAWFFEKHRGIPIKRVLVQTTSELDLLL